MIKNKKIALAFRLISLIIAVGGILLSSLRPGWKIDFSVFRYYTLQSNFLAVVLFAILSYKTIKSFGNGESGVSFFPRFEMICVVDLLLTLIVYWVILAPTSFSMNDSKTIFNYINLSVHLITPLLCLADYILFSKRKQLRYSDVYKVVVYPLLYVAFTTIAGFLGQVYRIDPIDGLPVRFPYFFFDYDRIGWLSLAYILGLVLFFIIIGHIFYFFDKKA